MSEVTKVTNKKELMIGAFENKHFQHPKKNQNEK